MNLNRWLVAEFVGSLLLCLAVCLGHSDFAAAAVYVVLFYSLGGQFNPLITVAAYLGGQATLPESGRRLAAQGLGALAASLVGLIWYTGNTPSIALGSSQFLRILAGELLGSFLLGVVYLRTSQTSSESGRSLGGALVGLAMVAGVTIFSRSVLNPAAVITGVLLGTPWWMLVTGLLGSVVGIFGAAYFVHWWNQPASPAPAGPPAASDVPESPATPLPVALPEPKVEKLPSKKR